MAELVAYVDDFDNVLGVVSRKEAVIKAIMCG